MPKRVAMLETLRKDRPRRSRQTLHAPSLTRLPAPHLTPTCDPLPHSGHFPHKPLPQNHSPPDCCNLLPRSNPPPPRVHPPPDSGIFLRFLLRITPHPTHWDIPAIRLAFELLPNLTINTPRSCGSSCHPTCVFAALTRLPPCYSRALLTRLPPRVPGEHPRVP